MPQVAAPAPFDLRMGTTSAALKGWVAARGRDGSPMLKVTRPVDAEAAKRGLENVRLAGWEYGVGGPELTDDPATLKQVVTVAGSGTGAAGDTIGGGADGSYGALLPGPLITTAVVGSAGKAVRSLVAFTPRTGADAGTQLYFAAIGNVIWKTANPEFSSGVSAVLTYATGVKVRKLLAFQGTNSIPRLYAFAENAAIYSTPDGTNWVEMRGPGATYEVAPKAFLKTTDNGANYTDYTANIAGAGTASLSSLDTLANGDWVLIGSDQPFNVIQWDLAAATNANVSTAAIHYWGEGGWTTVGSVTDTTSAAGVTLSVDPGGMTFTRPAASWVVAALTDLGATGTLATPLTQAYFWVRVSFSAALDASVDIETVTLGRGTEGVAAVVDGDTLRWVGADTRTIYSTTMGGPYSLDITSGIDRLGASYAPVVGMEAVQDLILVYRTTDVSAVQADGTLKAVAPSLARHPAETNDAQALAAWDEKNSIYFATNAGMTQVDALTGQLSVMGPERVLAGTSGIQARVTAAVADRGQFLYACWRDDANSNSYLAKWGGYALGRDPDTGLPSTQHVDAWHIIGDLETTTIHGMGWWSASNQPYIAFGDGEGNVYSFRLPKGRDPRDANSGYRYSTRDTQVTLPTLRGSNPTRPVTLDAMTIRSRHLTATRYVAVATKSSIAAVGSYGAQFTATDDSTQDYQLTTTTHWPGVDVRLTMKADSTSVPWQVDEVLLHYQHPIRPVTRLIEVTVLVKDLAQAPDGRVIPKRMRDWLADLEALVAQETPIYVQLPARSTLPCHVRAVGEVFTVDDAINGPSEAVSLVLAGAGLVA